jgi:hypothetical protein
MARVPNFDLSPEHVLELQRAKRLLEVPSLAIRLSNLLGSPIEATVRKLPERWQARIVGVTRRSLQQALRVALLTMNPDSTLPTSDALHKLAVSLTGAAGGAFGLAALGVELPVSTTIMLRSIADIARAEGEHLRDPGAKLACIEVFALGGRSRDDDAVDSAYYAVRVALAQAVSEATSHLIGTASRTASPALVLLLSEVAARFGVQVSQKAAAQAVPIVGAGGGALINNLFIDHFQSVARGHFTVRRLERRYSSEVVRRAYDALT